MSLRWTPAFGLALLFLAIGGITVWQLKPRDSARTLTTLPVVASVTRHFDDTLQIDLGKTWFASVAVNGANQAAGTALTARMGERLASNGRLDETPYGSVRFFETSISVDRRTTLVPLRPEDGRGMPEGVSVMPVRYIELSPWPTERGAEDVQVTAYLSTHCQ